MKTDIPVTLAECRRVVEQHIHDSEYLLFLLAWTVKELEAI